MHKFKKLIEKAKRSKFYMSLLNRALWGIIPFNKPHRFRIVRISEDGLELSIPYRRKNLNHLKGIHACALATASEYVAGLNLILGLESDQYRLIMRKLEMEYFYQAKMACTAMYKLDEKTMEEKIKGPLQTEDAVFFICEVEIYDQVGNLISRGRTEWQIKKWSKVKTQL